jgi:Uncharacterised nucleotidyltransferase
VATREGFAGSFWPTAQQELILRAALLDEERSREAWRHVRPGLDVERLDRGSMALLPLLYERLTEHGEAEAFLPKLKGIYRYTWYRNQVGLRSLTAMLDALHDNGIGAIVLGDAALISAHYRRLGVRQLDEAAALVRGSEREAALAALVRAGWEVEHGGSGGHRSVAQAHAATPLRSSLYWRALIELVSAHDVADELWARRQHAELNGVATSTLSGAHELLYACLRGPRSRGSIMWLADAYTILGSPPGGFDWDELVDDALRLRSAARVRDVLAYLAEVLAAPVPDHVLEKLDAARTSARERLAYRVAGRGGPVLGNLATTVAAHIVVTREQSVLRAAATLPGFLRVEWGLNRASQLPAAAVRKGAAAISAARAGRHEPGD